MSSHPLKALWLGGALALTAALTLSVPALAQSYEPITAKFTGKGALIVPPNNALDINDGGTIEFWVAAGWQQTLSYDPAVIAYSGPQGDRFGIFIKGSGKALGVNAGDFFDGVPFDFTDGALHHVAVVTTGQTIDILIDGVFRKTINFGFADLPATQFSIGSDGVNSPFIGEIGQVRIWSVPLSETELKTFSLRPIVSTGPNAHPEIKDLVAVSAFGNPETGGLIIAGDPTQANLTLTRSNKPIAMPDLRGLPHH